MKPGRTQMQRRLVRLEEMTARRERRFVRLEEMTARRERRCVCGIPPEKLTFDSQAIVMAHGEGERTCPDCGRERIVVVMNHGFPLV